MKKLFLNSMVDYYFVPTEIASFWTGVEIKEEELANKLFLSSVVNYLSNSVRKSFFLQWDGKSIPFRGED